MLPHFLTFNYLKPTVSIENEEINSLAHVLCMGATTQAGKRQLGDSEIATIRIRKTLQYTTQAHQVNLDTDIDPDDLDDHELGRVAKLLFL